MSASHTIFKQRTLSVGIGLSANIRGGPQKVSAIAAIDLARNAHKATIFLPVLPCFYYYISLAKSPLSWIRAVRPYVSNWFRSRKFVFQDLLDDSQTADQISVKFILRRVSKRQLQGLDVLLIHSIDKVVEYRQRFPEAHQIYLVHHLEEHAHGHRDKFSALRQSFGGKILAISPFTAREISGHIKVPPVVPNPISPPVWSQRHAYDPKAPRRDLVFFWKGAQTTRDEVEIVQALIAFRPGTTVTVWCRHRGYRNKVQEALPGAEIPGDLSERELCDLYLNHSLLLFSSSFEGFGMPPIEALACGCIPVLHPHVGAAELYAVDGKNSLHLDGSPSETAKRLAGILDDNVALQGMRVYAPETILAFNPEGYGQRLLEAAGCA